MSKSLVVSFIVLSFGMLACAQQKAVVTSTTGDANLAFSGAEGFGKYTTGGRGGKVVVVSNLNDDGAGSFRDAVQKNYARIIVFAISGFIPSK